MLAEKPFVNHRYSDLFEALTSHGGWGNKTSALFVKSVYHLHNGEYQNKKLWDDAPLTIYENEHFYLPVDAVIEFIFQQLNISGANNFDGINSYLKTRPYKGKLMEVWDDLWFWGFITQHGNNSHRKLGWNENKYWALLHTEKDASIIKDIKTKTTEFINILKS